MLLPLFYPCLRETIPIYIDRCDHLCLQLHLCGAFVLRKVGGVDAAVPVPSCNRASLSPFLSAHPALLCKL